MSILSIDDFNYSAYDNYVGPDGQRRAKGLTPKTRRVGYRSSYVEGFQLPLLDEKIIPDIISQQEKDQNSLQHIRDIGNFGSRIPSTDQNGRGYCWAHSSTSAMLLERAASNQPFADLSAYMVACIIKGYRDEGGNGDESLDFIAQNGICTSKFWAQRSVDRRNDTPEMRKNAALHKALKWQALDTGRDLNRLKLQIASCLLTNRPLVFDLDWWGHSVCAARLISWNPFKVRIWNSWGDSWSDAGMGDLSGSKAIPDGCWVLVSQTASQN